MTIITYNDKKYDFYWRDIVLFIIFCPLIASFIYMIFDFFWVYILPPFIYPIVRLLNLFQNSPLFTFYQLPLFHMYVIDALGQPIVGFMSVSAGIHGYVSYAGICLMTPHNKFKNENANVWKRKFITFLIPAILLFVENILQTSLIIFLNYYYGVPIHPMNELIGILTVFFAVFMFYIISYLWLPEFSLFVIWIKDSIKERLSKKSLEERGEKETSRRSVIAIWTLIGLVVIIIFSILVIY